VLVGDDCSEDADHRDTILQAARDLRAAVRKRLVAASAALEAYDGATGDRLTEAIEFLRVIRESDHAYGETKSRVLERYARQFHGTSDDR
jgi:hypothetical protein